MDSVLKTNSSIQNKSSPSNNTNYKMTNANKLIDDDMSVNKNNGNHVGTSKKIPANFKVINLKQKLEDHILFQNERKNYHNNLSNLSKIKSQSKISDGHNTSHSNARNRQKTVSRGIYFLTFRKATY
jgi:hypothetical protein